MGNLGFTSNAGLFNVPVRSTVMTSINGHLFAVQSHGKSLTMGAQSSPKDGGSDMAAKWLLKSDPEHYSFFDLERDSTTVWDGIANNLALKNLRQIRRGDQVMIYHTGNERA